VIEALSYESANGTRRALLRSVSFEPGVPPEDSATHARAAAKEERRPTSWTSSTPYLLLAGAALVVLLVWRPIAGQLAESRAVASIPDTSRVQLYQRILANLQFCKGQSSEALERFCSAEAKFILDFPECDQECRQLARRFMAHPSR
jgi:hypothetical protein